VRAGQRESGGGVIESRIVPGRRAVALLARLREIRAHVIRRSRSLEILQVATDASGVRARQVEVPIHVTLSALQRGMRANQREARGAVIERRIIPGSGAVALLARGRET